MSYSNERKFRCPKGTSKSTGAQSSKPMENMKPLNQNSAPAKPNSTLTYSRKQRPQAQERGQQPLAGNNADAMQFDGPGRGRFDSSASTQENVSHSGSQNQFGQMHSGGVFPPTSEPLQHMTQPSGTNGVYVNNVTANGNAREYSMPPWVTSGRPFIKRNTSQGDPNVTANVNAREYSMPPWVTAGKPFTPRSTSQGDPNVTANVNAREYSMPPWVTAGKPFIPRNTSQGDPNVTANVNAREYSMPPWVTAGKPFIPRSTSQGDPNVTANVNAREYSMPPWVTAGKPFIPRSTSQGDPNVTANVNAREYSMPPWVTAGKPFIPRNTSQGDPNGVGQLGDRRDHANVATTPYRGSRRGRGRGAYNNSYRNGHVQRTRERIPRQEITNSTTARNMVPMGYPHFYQYYPNAVFGPPPQEMNGDQVQNVANPAAYMTRGIPEYATGPPAVKHPEYMIPPGHHITNNRIVETQTIGGTMTAGGVWYPHVPVMEYCPNPEHFDTSVNHNVSPPHNIVDPIQEQVNTMNLCESSPLQQQPLKSHDQTQENAQHLPVNGQVMYGHMLNNGHFQCENVHQVLSEHEQPSLIHSGVAQQLHIQGFTDMRPQTVDEASLLHAIPNGHIQYEGMNQEQQPQVCPVIDQQIHARDFTNVGAPIADEQTISQAISNDAIHNHVQEPTPLADPTEPIDGNDNPEQGKHIVNSIVMNHNVPGVSPKESLEPVLERDHQMVESTASLPPIVPQERQIVIVADVPAQLAIDQHQDDRISVSDPIASHPNFSGMTPINNPPEDSVPVTNMVPAETTPSDNKTATLTNQPPEAKSDYEFSTKKVESNCGLEVPPLPIDNSDPERHNSSWDSSDQGKTNACIATSVEQTTVGAKPSDINASDTRVEAKVFKAQKSDECKTEPKKPSKQLRTSGPQPSFSWASLFTNKGLAPGSVPPPPVPIPANSPIKMGRVKKPVAKVLPFERASDVTKSLPGGMLYSVASMQGLFSSDDKPMRTAKTHNSSSDSDGNLSGPVQDVHGSLGKLADFLIQYKTDGSLVRLRPRGLTNCSNYCYLNAILQSLVGCPPFYNLMKSISKLLTSAQLERTNFKAISAMIALISEFSHLPPGASLQSNRYKKRQKKGGDQAAVAICDPAFTPHDIYKLWNDSRTNAGAQEDAEEFLGFVLNRINDEMLEIIKLNAKASSKLNGEKDMENESEDPSGDDWQTIYNKRNKSSVTRQTDFGRSPLSDIFRGELRSRLQREGEHSTDNIQPFFTLQLNIEKATSVTEGLELLAGRDQIEGVKCSKENKEVKAWQQTSLEKLPAVLILHLKLFNYNPDGCAKIIKAVEFPVELKIDTKILGTKKYSQKQRTYRLFAVVYHEEKVTSKGHYMTDVFHNGYRNWMRFDDGSVKPVSEHDVLHPRSPRVPYLLYYSRCDM